MVSSLVRTGYPSFFCSASHQLFKLRVALWIALWNPLLIKFFELHLSRWARSLMDIITLCLNARTILGPVSEIHIRYEFHESPSFASELPRAASYGILSFRVEPRAQLSEPILDDRRILLNRICRAHIWPSAQFPSSSLCSSFSSCLCCSSWCLCFRS